MTLGVNTIFPNIPTEFSPLLPYEQYLITTMGDQIANRIPRDELRGKYLQRDPDENHEIRGKFLSWMLREAQSMESSRYCKMEIRWATISGEVILDNLELDFPLDFFSCIFGGTIHLTGVRVSSLIFDRCEAGEIRADFLECKHDMVFINSSIKEGELNLYGATINGNLILNGSKLENPTDHAIQAMALTIRSDAIFSNGFFAAGMIDMRAASIGGNLLFEESRLENPDDITLAADRIHVSGKVFFSDAFVSKGSIVFTEAQIDGRLECSHCLFENPDGESFSGQGIKVNGPVLFNEDFISKGTVSFFSAEFGNIFDCRDCQFDAPEGTALSVQSSNIKASVFLGKGFHASGRVNLIAVKIGGFLYCRGGQFENPKGTALDAGGIVVEGPVFLGADSVFSGIVTLYGARINGELDCEGAHFKGAKIEGETNRICFLGQQMIVNGDWKLKDFKEKPNGEVWLSSARVGRISDDSNSWPSQDLLNIDGFEYESFLYGERSSIRLRIDWIHSQFPGYQGVRAYEQLASVYRKMGLRDEVRLVLIEKEKFILSRTKSKSAKAWKWFLGQTIDFGYSPQKLFIPILLFIIAGAFVFQYGNTMNVMTPTTSQVEIVSGGYEPYPQFNSILYSLDVFLPIVDIHQESYWVPNINRPYGIYFMVYMAIHIMAGWFLTTLGVASVTGLIKTD